MKTSLVDFTVPYLKALKIIRSRYSSFPRDFFLVFISILLLSLFAAFVPLFLREAADLLSRPDAEAATVFIFVAAYAFSWTFCNTMEWMKSIATSHVMVRCDTAFYKSLFDCLLGIPLHRQQSLSKGAVLSDFDRSMSSFGLINQTLFWTLSPMLFEFFFVFLILWKATNILFSTLFLMSMTALFCVALWVSQQTRDVHRKSFEATNRLSNFLVEKLDANYEIGINQSQAKESRKLDPIINIHATAVFRANARTAFLLSIQTIAIGLVLLSFTLASSYMAMYRSFGVGDFVMVASYIVQLTMPFAVVASSLVGLKRDYLALEEGLKYFDLVEPDHDVEGTRDRGVLFEVRSYRTNRGESLNVRIDGGKTYAVCGPTGSGKTTLMNALLGLNREYEGAIKFMGTDVSALSPKTVMDRVSVVSQNPFIFSGTVRENLLYGTEDQLGDDELTLALDALGLDFGCADDSSRLELIVGGENRPLSGGERQRIAIARAALRKKDVMILDEPTSALDGEMEERVLEFLKSRISTLILITHREAPKAMADEVIDLGSQAVAPA
ncbi:Lipid A export ATP-binding/permease protein MsbA [compost metagenome]